MGFIKLRELFCGIIILLTAVQGSKISFKASPEVLKGNLSTAASMRCSLSDTDVTRSVTNTSEDVTHVISILITRNEDDKQVDVAQGSPYDAPAALADIGNLQVKGDISGTSSESYIELTWRVAALVATGDYTCEVVTLDQHRHHVVFTSTLSLSRQSPTLDDVVIMVQTQHNQIQDLVSQQAKDASKIRSQEQTINNLQQTINNQQEVINNQQKSIDKQHEVNVNQSNEITSLKEKEKLQGMQLNNQSLDITKLQTCTGRRVAFMAVMNFTGAKKHSGDERVIYDKVIVNTDGGFDPKVSQFKATTPGVYEFSFGGASGSGYITELDLTVNSVKVTSTVFYGEHWQSGFASAVVVLKKGDLVHIETESSMSGTNYLYQNTIYAHYANTFSGQLLHSDDCLMH